MHGERCRFRAVRRVRLRQDVRDVVVDRGEAEEKDAGDLAVGLSGGNEPQHLDLSVRQARRIRRARLWLRSQKMPEGIGTCHGHASAKWLADGADFVQVHLCIRLFSHRDLQFREREQSQCALERRGTSTGEPERVIEIRGGVRKLARLGSDLAA